MSSKSTLCKFGFREYQNCKYFLKLWECRILLMNVFILTISDESLLFDIIKSKSRYSMSSAFIYRALDLDSTELLK